MPNTLILNQNKMSFISLSSRLLVYCLLVYPEEVEGMGTEG